MTTDKHTPPAAQEVNRKRKAILLAMAAVFLAAGAAWSAWWLLAGRHRETTDNAYVTGNIFHVEPQVAGTVVWIGADDTDFVKEGQPLARLGEADLSIAMEKAKADLGDAVRIVANLRARAAQQKAFMVSRETDLSKTRDELGRRRGLVEARAVSREDFDRSKAAFQSADAALDAARLDVSAAAILAGGGEVAAHPLVMKAKVALREAYLNLRRAVIVAPTDGFVAKRTVQIGQRVAPGRPLMSVIPLNDVSIDANFKENQLRKMRVGQGALIKSDMYGSSAEFHGKVKGFGAGTGGVFAALPAQNATGNWIKIVQRVPVRIELDRAEVAINPLILGLSTVVTVDTHDQSGKPLSGAAPAREPVSTKAFDAQAEGVDSFVEEVFAQNAAAARLAPIQGK